MMPLHYMRLSIYSVLLSSADRPGSVCRAGWGGAGPRPGRARLARPGHGHGPAGLAWRGLRLRIGFT